jgi:hypothetical protein
MEVPARNKSSSSNTLTIIGVRGSVTLYLAQLTVPPKEVAGATVPVSSMWAPETVSVPGAGVTTEVTPR